MRLRSTMSTAITDATTNIVIVTNTVHDITSSNTVVNLVLHFDFYLLYYQSNLGVKILQIKKCEYIEHTIKKNSKNF